MFVCMHTSAISGMYTGMEIVGFRKLKRNFKLSAYSIQFTASAVDCPLYTVRLKLLAPSAKREEQN
jgi:hypothetical protein